MARRKPCLDVPRGLCRLIGGLLLRLLFIALIITLGLYFDKLFESLLVLVMIAQFELAYRQYRYGKSRDEPRFSVQVNRELRTVASDAIRVNELIELVVKNVGPTPAYRISVSGVLCGNKPLSPEEWSSHIMYDLISCLEPSASNTLALIYGSFFKELFVEKGCTLKVSYLNAFNERRGFRVAFHEYTPIAIVGEERPPGFLLSIPEYLALILRR